MEIQVGDLVQLTSRIPEYMAYGDYKEDGLGIVFLIDHDFYSMPRARPGRMDRAHVYWLDGTVTTEPVVVLNFLSRVE